MKNVTDKLCRETQNTHFMFNNFFSENRAIYEIMGKNIAERGRSQMKIWQMRIACWIPDATNTHSGYIILIVFFFATMVARTLSSVTLHVCVY